MRLRLSMGLLPLAFLLAAATPNAQESGEASGPPGDAVLQAPDASPPAPSKPASEEQASGRGEVDASGTEAAAGEDQADEEEATLEPIELQGSILANANASLPQDI